MELYIVRLSAPCRAVWLYLLQVNSHEIFMYNRITKFRDAHCLPACTKLLWVQKIMYVFMYFAYLRLCMAYSDSLAYEVLYSFSLHT